METLKEELNKERDLRDSLIEDNVKSLKAVILEKVLNQHLLLSLSDVYTNACAEIWSMICSFLFCRLQITSRIVGNVTCMTS